MDSLQDILGNRQFTPPDEIVAIKEFIKRRYNRASKVKIEQNAIIVTVASSALAATIYLERQALIDQCRLKKRLVVRSGR